MVGRAGRNSLVCGRYTDVRRSPLTLLRSQYLRQFIHLAQRIQCSSTYCNATVTVLRLGATVTGPSLTGTRRVIVPECLAQPHGTLT